MIRTLLVATLLLYTSLAHADTLFEVKRAVASLKGREPISARIDLVTTHSTSGKFGANSGKKTSVVEAAVDGDRVSIEVPRSLVDKARDEEASPGKEGSPEPATAVGSISLMTAAEALDNSHPFLHMLALGTLSGEAHDVLDGGAVRRLVLKMSQPVRKKEGVQIGELKFTLDQLTLWVGPDNLPVAAEHIQTASGGFLFLKGEETTHTKWRFGRKGDHFLILRKEEWLKFSGVGQTGGGYNLQTVTLH